jgi:hypothetical protein
MDQNHQHHCLHTSPRFYNVVTLLHINWTPHSSSCFRLDRHCYQNRNYWEKHCICDIMESIDGHTNRIQSLQIDSERMSAFITKAPPNLERVVHTRWTSSEFWLQLQRFPKLWYLDVGECDSSEHPISLELPRIMLARLRHLSIEIDQEGFWCHLIGLHGKSLKTLEITWNEAEAPILQKVWILECSALECIIDRERIPEHDIRVIRITGPKLEFCQYSSMRHSIRLHMIPISTK